MYCSYISGAFRVLLLVSKHVISLLAITCCLFGDRVDANVLSSCRVGINCMSDDNTTRAEHTCTRASASKQVPGDVL